MPCRDIDTTRKKLELKSKEYYVDNYLIENFINFFNKLHLASI